MLFEPPILLADAVSPFSPLPCDDERQQSETEGFIVPYDSHIV
jgi:hypothetical protein